MTQRPAVSPGAFLVDDFLNISTYDLCFSPQFKYESLIKRIGSVKGIMHSRNGATQLNQKGNVNV